MSIRREVLKQWRGWKNGTVDLAAAAVTTNTAIDLVRCMEKQARPIIESYTKSLDAKETQLPVYWYSLGSWMRDINGKTCGTNVYAPLLGTDNESPTDHQQDFSAPKSAKVGIEEYEEWLLDSQSFRWAYTLVQLCCMEFFTKVNLAYKRPAGSETLRLGNGARPDDTKLFEQVRTCRGHDVQWLYELSFMGNYGVGPVFPFIDEVSRGFRISESFPRENVPTGTLAISYPWAELQLIGGPFSVLFRELTERFSSARRRRHQALGRLRRPAILGSE